MYFELFRGDNRQWYYRIRAVNHVIIGQSEGYHNRQDALNAIAIIKREAGAAQIYES
jgi:uncharacterized protein